MRVLVHAREPEPWVDVVRARRPGVEVVGCDSYEGLPEALQGFEPEVVYGIRFDGTDRFPRRALLGSPGLRWVSVGGAGVDHLGVWDARELTVTNAAGVSAELMAEYVIGGALSWSLGLAGFAEHQRAHRWTDGSVSGLAGRNLLVVGLGHTGREVARLAASLGMVVRAVRADPAPVDGIALVGSVEDLHELVALADVVVLCLPLTDATRGLIDADVLAAFRPGSLLVDVSRGGIVVGSALVEALASGHLGGAVLDVFETEPLPADHPLWDLPGVLITPHCSSVDAGWERRSVELFCDNLDRWCAGEPLVNVVDPGKGY
ncbi:D-2-hydroxyacid dehydrogenase [soil metagenome]